jgi:hypothetical protein
MSKIFKENNEWTEDAIKDAGSIENYLYEKTSELIDSGYTLAEASYLLNGAVSDALSEYSLVRRGWLSR